MAQGGLNDDCGHPRQKIDRTDGCERRIEETGPLVTLTCPASSTPTAALAMGRLPIDLQAWIDHTYSGIIIMGFLK